MEKSPDSRIKDRKITGIVTSYNYTIIIVLTTEEVQVASVRKCNLENTDVFPIDLRLFDPQLIYSVCTARTSRVGFSVFEVFLQHFDPDSSTVSRINKVL